MLTEYVFNVLCPLSMFLVCYAHCVCFCHLSGFPLFESLVLSVIPGILIGTVDRLICPGFNITNSFLFCYTSHSGY